MLKFNPQCTNPKRGLSLRSAFINVISIPVNRLELERMFFCWVRAHIALLQGFRKVAILEDKTRCKQQDTFVFGLPSLRNHEKLMFIIYQLSKL